MLPISLFGRSLSRSAAPTQYSGWGNLPVTLRIQQDYLDISFDGWMLKPIDFKRLYVMLSASQNERVRAECLRAGTFEGKNPCPEGANTKFLASLFNPNSHCENLF